MNDWSRLRNLLCVRLDNMGDVLMTTPALRALKHTLPGCRLTLLASAAGAACARFVPELDDIVPYAPPWMKSTERSDADLDLAMAHELRARRFDGAVIFTAYSQSPLPAAMLCHLAHIPLRLAHCRENPYRLLTDWIAEPEPQQTLRHEVRRQLDLVAAIGCATNDERLSFNVPHADAAWARRHLQAAGIDLNRTWLLLHPGASAPSRRYPPQHWCETANRLASALRCPLVFTGDAGEIALVEAIRGGLAHPSYSLAGKLDLGKFAAVLAQAPALISNNTGPVHLAAAVGTPVVDLYALTNPQHTPWQVPNRVLYHDVPCSPCYKSICPQGHHDCMVKIAPARVVQETIDLLQDAYWDGFDGRKHWRRYSRADDRVLRFTPQRNDARRDGGGTLEPLTPIVISAPGTAGGASHGSGKSRLRRGR
ncbi:MAG TPA: glycosyltransferase family 9 protein [Paucimonas sp.]|nr:glycosyltransferase family 9 protein [Paucimonas sp.]